MKMTTELLAQGKARLEELLKWRREMAGGNAIEIGGAWRSVQNQIAYMEKFVEIPVGACYC